MAVTAIEDNQDEIESSHFSIEALKIDLAVLNCLHLKCFK
jgi:hypothetical protein